MALAALGNVNDLREKLKLEKDTQLKDLVTKIVFRDILMGLYQMHQNNYFHMDIKCENTVVISSGRALLIDFGCSEKIIPIEKEEELLLPLIKSEYDENLNRWTAIGK